MFYSDPGRSGPPEKNTLTMPTTHNGQQVSIKGHFGMWKPLGISKLVRAPNERTTAF